jgi:hypothetical protein
MLMGGHDCLLLLLFFSQGSASPTPMLRVPSLLRNVPSGPPSPTTATAAMAVPSLGLDGVGGGDPALPPNLALSPSASARLRATTSPANSPTRVCASSLCHTHILFSWCCAYCGILDW